MEAKPFFAGGAPFAFAAGPGELEVVGLRFGRAIGLCGFVDVAGFGEGRLGRPAVFCVALPFALNVKRPEGAAGRAEDAVGSTFTAFKGCEHCGSSERRFTPAAALFGTRPLGRFWGGFGRGLFAVALEDA